MLQRSLPNQTLKWWPISLPKWEHFWTDMKRINKSRLSWSKLLANFRVSCFRPDPSRRPWRPSHPTMRKGIKYLANSITTSCHWCHVDCRVKQLCLVSVRTEEDAIDLLCWIMRASRHLFLPPTHSQISLECYVTFSTAQGLNSKNLPGMMPPLLNMQILTPVMWSPGRGSRSASTSSTSPSWTTRMPSSPSQPWRWEHMTSIIQAPYKNNKRDSYNDLMLQFNDMIWLPLSGAPGLPGLPALLHRAHRRKQWQGKKAILSDTVTC